MPKLLNEIDKEIRAESDARRPLDELVARNGLRWTIDRLAAITYEKGLDSRGLKRGRLDRASIKINKALRELRAGD